MIEAGHVRVDQEAAGGGNTQRVTRPSHVVCRNYRHRPKGINGILDFLILALQSADSGTDRGLFTRSIRSERSNGTMGNHAVDEFVRIQCNVGGQRATRFGIAIVENSGRAAEG